MVFWVEQFCWTGIKVDSENQSSSRRFSLAARFNCLNRYSALDADERSG